MKRYLDPKGFGIFSWRQQTLFFFFLKKKCGQLPSWVRESIGPTGPTGPQGSSMTRREFDAGKGDPIIRTGYYYENLVGKFYHEKEVLL